MRGRPTDAEVLAAQELASRVASAGSLAMPLADVLALFEVQRFTTLRRERLANALDSADITAEPSLLLARRGETVVFAQRAGTVESPQRPRSILTRWTSHLGVGAKALLGVVLTFIVGGILAHFVDVDRYAEQAKWTVTNWSGAPSSCQDTGYFRRIDVTSASAIYELNAHPASLSYDPEGRNTAWRQVLRRTPSDFIAWGLHENPAAARHVRLICIVNGWARGLNTYQDTGRVHKLKVVGMRNDRPVAAKGCRRTQTLRDRPKRFTEFATIRIDCHVSKIKLMILSTHKGRVVANDAAISDVRFYG